MHPHHDRPQCDHDSTASVTHLFNAQRMRHPACDPNAVATTTPKAQHLSSRPTASTAHALWASHELDASQRARCTGKRTNKTFTETPHTGNPSHEEPNPPTNPPKKKQKQGAMKEGLHSKPFKQSRIIFYRRKQKAHRISPKQETPPIRSPTHPKMTKKKVR